MLLYLNSCQVLKSTFSFILLASQIISFYSILAFKYFSFIQFIEEIMFGQKSSKYRNTLGSNASNEHILSRIPIAQKYYINTLISQNDNFNLYKGVDAQKSKWVNIYAKRVQHNYELSNKIKEHLRSQLCPKILWTGPLTISKMNYFLQVHQRFGPSLRSVFDYKNIAPTQKQLLHLLYQMIKLVQKMNNVNLVCGQLSPDLITLDVTPLRNDLYLLNCFKLKKKREVMKPICTKYCSRGVHLGRNITTKDDLQSVCYILIDIFSQSNFLHDKDQSQFEQAKLSMNIEQFAHGVPSILVDFYHYVTSLNYNDEINFFYWKNNLLRILTSEIVSKPFGFLLKKEGSKTEQTNKWSACFKKIQKRTEEDQIKQYEESENVIRLNKITSFSLKN